MNVDCKFVNLCGTCDINYARNCCLYSILKKGNFKLCMKNNICPNVKVCEKAVDGSLIRSSLFNRIIPTIEDISEINFTIKKPYEKFSQAFIPRIEIGRKDYEEQVEVFNILNINTIAVSLRRLLSRKIKYLIKKSYLKDLHETVKFDGKIMLITTVHDYYCIKLMNKIDQYLDELKILNPDIITTFDANFYLDQPLFITAIQTFNILKANEKIKDVDIAQVAIIPPSPKQFFKPTLETFLNINYKTICIPLAELNKEKNKYRDIIIKEIKKFKSMKNYNFEYLLLSTSPSSKYFADCYSTLSWYIKRKTAIFSSKKNYWTNKLKKYQLIIENKRKQK
ncbi:MAG: hypothetical protein P8Y97_10230, partial [Candidatus Lokiarchaeota archaeon]